MRSSSHALRSVELRRLLPALLVAGITCVASVATPGTARAEDTGIAADRFVPAAGGDGFLGIEGATAPLPWSVTAALSGATHLIAFTNRYTGAAVSTPLATAVTLDVSGEVAVNRRFSIGLGLPLALVLEGNRLAAVGDATPFYTPVAGDLRLRARIHLYSAPRDLVSLAAVLVGTVPAGGEHELYATSGPTIEPRFVAEVATRFFRAALLAGYRVVPARRLLDTRFESELHLGAAVDGRIFVRTVRLHAIAETEAATGGPYLELRGGLRVELPRFSVDGGAGFGLLHAPTNPAWRLFFAVTFHPEKNADGNANRHPNENASGNTDTPGR